MRILAIRGRNLASLAGDFAVELDAAPLAQAGLFAITGPTGAGKSTLLDALCLALYDAMPRLAGAPKVAVASAVDAGEGLNADDVRNVLRRGCSEGFAEVDFVGLDRRRYRARWELRRARGRADGRVQAQTLRLLDLDAQQPLGGTKTETLAAIQTRLGLSFEQFRRSVLLAQGDFANFLRAPAKERAELLERITGTQLYGELSRAAHRRARDEEEALQALEHGLAVLAPLDESALAELRAGHERHGATLAALETRLTALRRFADWQMRQHVLAAELAAAVQARAQAQAGVDAADARRRAWLAISAAQALRPFVEAAERSRAAADLAGTRLGAAAQALASAEARFEHARALSQHAEAQQAAADAQRLQAAAGLALAHGLDGRIADAAARCESARQLAAQAAQAARDGQARLAGLQQQIAHGRQARDEAAGWLEAHAGIEALAGQWPRWQAAFGRLIERGHESVAARQTSEQAGHAHAAALVELAGCTQRLAAATAARERAETEVGRLSAALAAADAPGLAARRRRLAGRRERLQPLPALVERAAALAVQSKNLTQRLADWQRRGQELQDASAARQQILPVLRARADEAALAARRAELAAADSVAHLRAQLAEGEPCPVCGALAHPWAQALPALDALAETARRHAEELRRDCETAVTDSSMLHVRATEARTRLAEAQAETEILAAEQAGLLQRWQQRPPDESLPDDPLVSGLAGDLSSRLGELQSHLDALLVQEAEALQLADDQQQAQQALAIAIRAHEDAQRDHAQHDALLERLARDRAQADLQCDQLVAAVEALRAEIATPCAALANADTRLRDAPAALQAAAAQAVEDWRQAGQRRVDAEAGLARLGTQQAAAEAAAALAAEADVQAARGADDAVAMLAALRRDRAGLFDGRPTQDVEAGLARAVADAVAEREAAQSAMVQAASGRDLAAGQAQAAGSAREQAVTEAGAAGEALAAALAEAGLDAAEARQRLQHDAQWLAAEAAVLDALTAALHEADIRFDERQVQAAAHAAARPPLPPTDAAGAEPPAPDELAGCIADATAAVEAARAQLADYAVRLRADEHCRSESAVRRAALDDRRRQAEPWLALKELIGSADGAKFRSFAQSLTLDALVAHASHHLQDLARRYALRRVPGAELELMVVDRDMADEVRGVHSLSGGETFLVSLALALGLASLSSDRVQVGTLLIDEGFGTLDPETLDVAIAALDALQGLGRQVGVISHVPALVERIGVQVRVRALGGGRSCVESLIHG